MSFPFHNWWLRAKGGPWEVVWDFALWIGFVFVFGAVMRMLWRWSKPKPPKRGFEVVQDDQSR